LTLENQEEWVGKAVELPRRKLEEEVAIVAPEASVRDGVKPISWGLSQLKVGISKEFEAKLKRVQDLESQRTRRAVKISEALEASVDLYLEKKDPVKKAERFLVRENNADACVARHVSGVIRSGIIPAKTKHQVIPRSQGGTDGLENLTTLCSAHHRMEHKAA
jgi:hypothetical protein